jgi:hypothetical protein
MIQQYAIFTRKSLKCFGHGNADQNRFSDCRWDAQRPEGRLAVDDKSPAVNIGGGMYLSAQCFVKV